jgi:hypothetical protein
MAVLTYDLITLTRNQERFIEATGGCLSQPMVTPLHWVGHLRGSTVALPLPA